MSNTLPPDISTRRRVGAQKWKVLQSNVIGAYETANANDGLNWLVGWRETFNRPSVKALLDLKRQLNTADSQWIRAFLEQNGVERLLRVFQSLCGKTVLTFVETLLQLSCVGCIRAVMNSRTGLEYIIENQEFVNKLSFALHNCDVSVKAQIFALLSSLCLYSDEGHARVQQILHAYKESNKKQHRFSLIVDDLRKCENTANKSSLLALINCIINGQKRLEERVRVRNEFLGLQLGVLVEGLRKESEQDNDLSIQLDVFDEKRIADDELLPGPEGVDLTSHNEVFQSIYKQVVDSGYDIPFLAILQHLLQISTNASVRSDAVWDTIEKLVFRAALMDKDDDPDKLLQTGSKRLERATCKCNCGHDDGGANEARKKRLNSVAGLLPMHRSLPSIWSGSGGLSLPSPTQENRSSFIVDIPIDEDVSDERRERSSTLPPKDVATSPSRVVPPPPPHRVPPPPPPHRTGPPPPPPPPPDFKSPPPPPPPPMPGALPAHPKLPITPGPVARGLETTPSNVALPQIPPPTSKMRTLQWSKITAQKIMGKNSVWSEMTNNGTKMDFARIAELFSVAQKRTSTVSMKDPSSDQTDRKKKEEILLLDGKRSLNVNIFLRQFRHPTEAIMDMVKEGLSEEMGVEKLFGLLRILPVPDEIEMLRSYDGDKTKLGSAEKFLLQLLDINEYKLRIEAMLLKEEFNQKMEQIKPAIDAVILASKDIAESSEIKEIFSMILLTGNYINAGSYAGNAAGFKLSTLLKLSEVRANVPRMNLLHFLVLELENHRPELLTFYERMRFLDEASQCSIECINNDLRSLEQRTRCIRGQIHNTDEKFQQRLSDFLTFADTELKELELDMEEVESQRKQLSAYLCEDEKQFNLEECFKTFSTFCQRFKKAIEENKNRKIHEQKMDRMRRQKEESNTRKLSDTRSVSVSNGPDESSRIIDRLLGNIKSGYITGDVESVPTTPRKSQGELFDGADKPTFRRQTWMRSSDERPRSRPQSDELERIFEDSSDSLQRRRRLQSDDVTLIDYLVTQGGEENQKKWETTLVDRTGSVSKRRRRRPDDVRAERERDVISSAATSGSKPGHRRCNSDVNQIEVVGPNHPRTGSDPTQSEDVDIAPRRDGAPRPTATRDSGIDSPKTNSRPTSLDLSTLVPSSPPPDPETEKLAARNKRRQERAKREKLPSVESFKSTSASLPSEPVVTSRPLPAHSEQLVTSASASPQTLPRTKVISHHASVYTEAPQTADKITNEQTATSSAKGLSNANTQRSLNLNRRWRSNIENTDIDKVIKAIEETGAEIQVIGEEVDQHKAPKSTVLQPTHRDRPIENKTPTSYSDTAVSDKTSILLDTPATAPLTGSQDASNVQSRFKQRWKSFLRQRGSVDGDDKDDDGEGAELKVQDTPPSPTSPMLQRRRSRRWLQQLANTYTDDQPNESESPTPKIMLSEDITESNKPAEMNDQTERPRTLPLPSRSGFKSQEERLEEHKSDILQVERVDHTPEYVTTPEEGASRLPSPNSRAASPLSSKKSHNSGSPPSTPAISESESLRRLSQTQSLSSLTTSSGKEDHSGVSKLNKMLARLPKRRNLGIRRSRSNADVDAMANVKNAKNQSKFYIGDLESGVTNDPDPVGLPGHRTQSNPGLSEGLMRPTVPSPFLNQNVSPMTDKSPTTHRSLQNNQTDETESDQISMRYNKRNKENMSVVTPALSKNNTTQERKSAETSPVAPRRSVISKLSGLARKRNERPNAHDASEPSTLKIGTNELNNKEPKASAASRLTAVSKAITPAPRNTTVRRTNRDSKADIVEPSMYARKTSGDSTTSAESTRSNSSRLSYANTESSRTRAARPATAISVTSRNVASPKLSDTISRVRTSASNLRRSASSATAPRSPSIISRDTKANKPETMATHPVQTVNRATNSLVVGKQSSRVANGTARSEENSNQISSSHFVMEKHGTAQRNTNRNINSSEQVNGPGTPPVSRTAFSKTNANANSTPAKSSSLATKPTASSLSKPASHVTLPSRTGTEHRESRILDKTSSSASKSQKTVFDRLAGSAPFDRNSKLRASFRADSVSTGALKSSQQKVAIPARASLRQNPDQRL